MENRYMIVTYLKKPDGKWDEYTEFSKKLKPKHLSTAKVILDFQEKRCVVNTLNKEADFESMLEMYKRLLGDKLTPHLPQI
jgi:hypothetical protein